MPADSSAARIPPGIKGVNVVQEEGPVGGVPEPGGLPAASSAAQAHELRLTWAFSDPGLVHLARHGSTRTLCDKTAILAFVSRRSVTCSTCKEAT